MYKLSDFKRRKDNGTNFFDVFASKWDELHEVSDVFRYKTDTFQEKFVGDYMLLLNIDRNVKRRSPENIKDICQPFDSSSFNFTKVSSKEILFSIESEGDVHSLLVNVSPISRYHSLLCPSIKKCLPQVVTAESLHLAAQLLLNAQDRNLRIVFNSLCGLASVNHLHYHLVENTNDLAVERVKWVPLYSQVFRLDYQYPVPGLCFVVQKHSLYQNISAVYKVLEYFLKNSIAHNILMTMRGDQLKEGAVGVIIWPRKSTKGAKVLSAFNVAALELSGWFPVYDAESFANLTTHDLERELSRWSIDNFEELCDEIRKL